MRTTGIEVRRCVAFVSTDVVPVRCTRNAVVDRDGDWFCWQHDPIRQAKRRDLDRAQSDWRVQKTKLQNTIAGLRDQIVDAVRAGPVAADLFLLTEKLARAEQAYTYHLTTEPYRR
jgi:hypothetical protein